MISQTAEYALRAVVHLAAREGENEAQTVGQIAQGTQVPAGYLSKVLQQLTRAGVITSQRGQGGGFRLAKAPDQISIYEVVQVVDPLQRIHRCPLGLDAHESLCPLHKRLDEAMALIERQFRDTTIAELLTPPAGETVGRQIPSSSALCVFPLDSTPNSPSKTG